MGACEESLAGSTKEVAKNRPRRSAGRNLNIITNIRSVAFREAYRALPTPFLGPTRKR